MAATAIGETTPEAHDVVFASTSVLLAKRPKWNPHPPLENTGALALLEVYPGELGDLDHLATAWQDTSDGDAEADSGRRR